MFGPCSRYVPTVLELFFDCALGMFRPCSTVLDRAPGMFRPCSRYAWTVLEVCLDRARGTFRPCSSYFSTVL